MKNIEMPEHTLLAYMNFTVAEIVRLEKAVKLNHGDRDAHDYCQHMLDQFKHTAGQLVSAYNSYAVTAHTLHGLLAARRMEVASRETAKAYVGPPDAKPDENGWYEMGEARDVKARKESQHPLGKPAQDKIDACFEAHKNKQAECEEEDIEELKKVLDLVPVFLLELHVR